MLPPVEQGLAVGSATAPGTAAGGRGRLVVTYLAIVAVDAWVASVLTEADGRRGPIENLLAGTAAFATGGFALIPWVALAMIPGVALAVAVIARNRSSVIGRLAAGACSWCAWAAVVALGFAAVFRQPVLETWAVPGLPLLAASGAAFGAIGVRAETTPPGRGLTTAAILIAGAIVVVSVLLAGRFPGPA